MAMVRADEFTVVLDDWGQFRGASAIEKSATSADWWNGGQQGQPYTKSSRATVKPFSITRIFDPYVDLGRYRKYEPLIGNVYLQCSITPLDGNRARIGPYFTGRALLLGITLPEIDTSSPEGEPKAPILTLNLKTPRWTVAG